MKVVILAGGKGTRISEESIVRPKPMIEIGGKPIIWHIMKLYSHYGHNEFVICAGYMQEYIKQWFSDYFINSSDVTFDYTSNNEITIHTTNAEKWKVTVVDTGYNTMTGGRIKRIQPYIDDDQFLLTYGDGVCDVNIDELISFHQSHNKIATITSIIQSQSKGILNISDIGEVRSFREKAVNDGVPINAGYMVLNSKIFDYLENDSTILESSVLESLALNGQLMSFKHTGFWQCMDSLREKELLEKYWSTGNAPWKVW